MAEKAIELSLINKKRKVKIHTELHVDRKKILQRELNELYAKLGRSYTPAARAQPGLTELRKKLLAEAAEKEKELAEVEPNPNDATDIEELTRKLSEYVMDHVRGKVEGTVSEQIMPLMSRIMAQALTQHLGEFEAAVLLATDAPRHIILYCMTIGFTMYNLLKTHGMKIVTHEEPVTDAELEDMRRISEENKEIIRKMMLGGDDMPFKVPSDEGNESKEEEE